MREMLEKAGIPFEEIDVLDGYAGEGVHTEIAVRGGKDDAHWNGYANFISSMYFGIDGGLVAMGAWE
jgi:hypothetical protein